MSKPVSDHLVTAGRPPRQEGRHVNLPIELGSTMVFDTMAAFNAAFDARYDSGTMYYGRYGNEAVYALEGAIAALDGADGAVLTSSGVAAISCTLMAVLKAGDHLLVADNVYGNTRGLCDKMLAHQGIEITYYDPQIGATISTLFRDNTKAVMFEAPGSGTFEVPDIPAISAACRDAGVMTIIDATWPTALFCQPLALGVDVVIASGSKFLCGHSDAMLGTIVANQPVLGKIRIGVNVIGDKPGAQEVYLCLRGLRTLEMRMAHVDRAGTDMAQWFATLPQVQTVLHPALPDCPGHAEWQRDFTGAAGLFGVVFKTPDPLAATRFVDALQHFGIGVSWGGYESLVLPVNPTRTATDWTNPGQLIRFNIGFDNLDTLKADISQALKHL